MTDNSAIVTALTDQIALVDATIAEAQREFDDLTERQGSLRDSIAELRRERDRYSRAAALISGATQPPAAADIACPKCDRFFTTKNGLDIHNARTHKAKKTPPSSRPPSDTPAHTGVDHAEVARVACAANKLGEPMGPAVADHFGIKRGTADMRIMDARRAGHVIPAGNTHARQRDDVPANNPDPASPLASKPIATGFVLACDDCDDVFDTPGLIIRHTLEAHGRAVHRSERTPVRRGADTSGPVAS